MKYLFNKLLIFAVIFTLSSNIFSITNNKLQKKQARNYIENIVASLFAPSTHSRKTIRVIDNFSEDATDQLLSNYNYKSHGIKYYDSAKIYNATLKKSVDFIESKSRNYAYKFLSRKYYSDKHIIADQVAVKISNEAWSIINSNTYLVTGALTKFIGSSLKSKVKNLVNQKLDNYNHKFKSKLIKDNNTCTICNPSYTTVTYTPVITYPVYYPSYPSYPAYPSYPCFPANNARISFGNKRARFSLNFNRYF